MLNPEQLTAHPISKSCKNKDQMLNVWESIKQFLK